VKDSRRQPESGRCGRPCSTAGPTASTDASSNPQSITHRLRTWGRPIRGRADVDDLMCRPALLDRPSHGCSRAGLSQTDSFPLQTWEGRKGTDQGIVRRSIASATTGIDEVLDWGSAARSGDGAARPSPEGPG